MAERKSGSVEEGEQPKREPVPDILFDPGDIAITTGALLTLTVSNRHVAQYLSRHLEGDWGDLPEEDVEQNRRAIAGQGRVFSAYNLESGSRIYVITEWDRTLTTVLLPSEY